MGAWGTGLFSNDLAADLRGDFRDLIADGLAPEEATNHLLVEYNIKRNDADVDNNDFWLALAYIQHQLGHADPDVITRAVSIAKDPKELERWEPADRPKRRQVLEKLYETLAQPLPAPKKIKKRTKTTTALQVGQHILWNPGFGRPNLLLRVTEIWEDKGGIHPVVVALDYDGSDKALRKAQRLKPIITKDILHTSGKGAFGFILSGSPGDPPDLHILDMRSDWRTPSARQQKWVTPWSGLYKWFDTNGKPSSDYV
jgi:hypothetical protein